MDEKELSLGSLYDINKSLMANEKPFDPIILKRKCKDISSDMKSEYYMLLNKEKSDYTLFHLLPPDTVDYRANEIFETFTNRGQVISTERLKDGNWEIWIRDPETNENYCYYLFDYSFGIVEV